MFLVLCVHVILKISFIFFQFDTERWAFNIFIFVGFVALMYDIGMSMLQFLRNNIALKIGIFGLAELAIVLSVISSVCVQIIFKDSERDIYGVDAHSFLVAWSVVGLMWFYIGKNFYRLNLKRFNIIIVTQALIFVAGLMTALDGDLVLSYWKLNELSVGEYSIDHTSVTDTAIFVILLLCFVFPYRFRVPLLCFASVVLFSLGGRSSFFSFCLIALIYLAYTDGVKFGVKIFAYACVAYLFVWLFLLSSSQLDDQLVQRMLFIGGIENDDSNIDRKIIATRAFSFLIDQALFGDVLVLATEFSMGEYIHNIMSLWQFYGIFGFASFLFAYGVVLYYIYLPINRSVFSVNTFGLLIVFMAFASLFMGKTVLSALVWFAPGYWLGYLGSIYSSKPDEFARN